MKKKLQIFVSSTYTDLKKERQSAVEAILRSKNIPAGMELFSAGNKSQLETIKKWIDESDIYVLILGGRYGSLEPETQISYTEIEYQYAVEIGKPFFAIILNDDFIKLKVKEDGQDVLELDNQDKYRKFKEFVLSKVCKFCKDESEIKLAILESLLDIQSQFNLTGWVKGDEIPDNSIFSNEIEILRSERDELIKKISNLETLTKKTSRNKNIGDFTLDEITKVLKAKKIIIPANLGNGEEPTESNAFILFLKNTAQLTTGLTSTFANNTQNFLITRLVPVLLNFELVERKLVRNAGMKMEYDKFILSPLGNKYLSLIQINGIENK